MKTLSSFGGHSFLILAWCGIHNNITVHIEFTQLHKRDNVPIKETMYQLLRQPSMVYST